MIRIVFKTSVSCFALIVLTICISAPLAQAQHGGHTMPAPAKPKRKPAKKPAPKKKAPPTVQTEQKAEEPKPAVVPAPDVAPPDTESTSDEPTVTPSPAGSNVSDAPQTPEPASPNPPVEKATPPTHDHSQMNDAPVKGTDDSAQSPGTDDAKEPMSSDTGTSDASNELMVMSGDSMDIRVGDSKRNSIAMGQMGSGTSWQPTTTPMYMWFKSAGKWLLFFHGDLKLGVNHQGGPRGVTKFESENWLMPMAFRRVGKGTLQLRGMFSLEPFTFPRGGSPLLFQTGETFEGRPIVDAQHPHDLFMELSANYTLPLGERATWFTYLGFPGEPALGPTAFMHRMSASENPSAPLTHHLQDSTHITFGVFTTGFTYRWFKLEGSVFNGREPDEDRYNFEFNPWNSRSLRISVAPNENWSAQWSYGLLRDPEALAPGDVRRMTASVSYNRRFKRGNWATSLIWGRNRESHDEPQTLNGYTAESTLNFLDKNYVYTRLELVDKNSLLSHDEAQSLGFVSEHPSFRIGSYTFGYVRDVLNTKKFSIGVGGDFTFYSKPDVLDGVYGSTPTSNRLFVRIRPSRMSQGQGHKH